MLEAAADNPSWRLLPQVLELVGEEHVMIQGDMPHAEARDTGIRELREHTDLSDKAKRKILRDNAMTFYTLS